MNILEKHQDKVEWIAYYSMSNHFGEQNEYCIFTNPLIFTYNYKKIKEKKHNINKDFVEWVWNPENMNKWKLLRL
jgi:hypothetical protein